MVHETVINEWFIYGYKSEHKTIASGDIGNYDGNTLVLVYNGAVPSELTAGEKYFIESEQQDFAGCEYKYSDGQQLVFKVKS